MQAAIVITLMTLAIAIPLLKNAFAVTDIGNAGVFELDGNIVKNASTACPTDWGPGPGVRESLLLAELRTHQRHAEE